MALPLARNSPLAFTRTVNHSTGEGAGNRPPFTMPSNLQVITLALRDINVLAQSEPPAAEQADEALQTLNQMMAAWQSDGIDLQYFEQTNVTDDLPVAAGDVLAVRYNLALLLAPSYQTEAPPTIIAAAAATFEKIARESTIRNMVERQSETQSPGAGQIGRYGNLYTQ